ncbi:hypothetical protein [Nocardia takedensis]|uniref:hypothetical protein n=1 Tax=Nocardia takedensis TaxID=259390 RepID=UPI000687EE34|nr:hypothetical protein [Nocardia takedensis]
MPTNDIDRARSRFLTAIRRIRAGLDLQRSRILGHAAIAHRLLEGTPEEVVDLTGAPDNDLDYYAYELVRLREAAREMSKVFAKPRVVEDALAMFDESLPKLRSVRNPLTHPSDDARLDGVAWFSALVELRSDGSVEYLVDPRYQHHDAGLALADTLISYLREGIRSTPPNSVADGRSTSEREIRHSALAEQRCDLR